MNLLERGSLVGPNRVDNNGLVWPVTYQRGVAKLLRRGRNEDSLVKAVEYFELAIKNDPGFASAYGALGHTIWVQLLRG